MVTLKDPEEGTTVKTLIQIQVDWWELDATYTHQKCRVIPLPMSVGVPLRQSGSVGW